jgi:putative ABC transport system substrate-binding protein
VDRRRFVLTSLASGIAAPLAAEAQRLGKVFRIGVLAAGIEGGSTNVFRQSLSELGYVDGRNLAIEWREAEGKPERFADLAAELVRLKVDAIVAMAPAATFAAKRVTAVIPIVMVNTLIPFNWVLSPAWRAPAEYHRCYHTECRRDSQTARTPQGGRSSG